MREFYKPVHFKIEEFVDQPTFKKLGSNSLIVMDPRILKIADGIRDYFGKPVIINNWHAGGSYENRGFRSPESKTGAHYSQHRFGRAIDLTVEGMTAEMVRNIIINNQEVHPFNLITAMELGVSWVHADVRMVDKASIYTFYP